MESKPKNQARGRKTARADPGTIDISEEFFRITRTFNKHRVRYCVVGGMAVGFYADPRFTDDIDVIVDRKQVARARSILEAVEYIETAPPWTFQSTRLTLYRFMKIRNRDSLVLDVLAGDQARHDEILRRASRVRTPHGIVRVALPEDLIWMKRRRNADLDKADIERLKSHAYRENTGKDS